MTILPVVERELRVASRRWTTYWGRALVALAAVGVTTYGVIIAELIGNSLGVVPGKFIFWGLSAIGMFFATLGGLSYTSDTVSKERREGTLGLLFLTDLSGLDVSLGKLASSSFGAFYGLLAFQPVMSIAFLLGGITGGEYARMCLLLSVTLLSSLGAGLAASTFTESSRTAGLIAFVFSIIIVGLFPIAGLLGDDMLYWFFHIQDTNEIIYRPLSRFSAIMSYINCADVDYRGSPEKYWYGLNTTAAFGLTAFVLASRRLPHVWQDKAKRHRRNRLQSLLRASSTAKKWAALLDLNPISWLAERHFSRRIMPWGILMASVIGFGIYSWRSQTGPTGYAVIHDFGFLFFATGVIHTGLKFWVSNEAGRQLMEDRRSGALELQLATPLSVSNVIKGHLLAIWRMARIPLLIVTALDWSLFHYAANISYNGGNDDIEVPMCIAREFLLWVDLGTLAWVGLDAAMVSRSGQAANGVIARVLLVPWLFVITTALFIAFLFRGSQFHDPGASSAVLAWTFLCVVNDAFWGLRARARLRSEFRHWATVPIDASGGFWLLRIFKRS